MGDASILAAGTLTKLSRAAGGQAMAMFDSSEVGLVLADCVLQAACELLHLEAPSSSTHDMPLVRC